MSGKKVILALALFGAIFAAVLWGSKRIYAPSGNKTCQVCLRAIHEGQEFTLTLKDGKSIAACCPRCGLHFEQHHSAEVASMRATDFVKGDTLPATEGVFVETTGISFCGERTVERGEVGVEQLQWDRCMPSLVAFRNREEAERFQRLYGGRLLSYQESVESVTKR